MEKQPHDEYRDKLAGKLREIRDAGKDSEDSKSKITRAEAKGYLNAKQESEEYAEAKEYRIEEREEQFIKKINEAKLLKIESELLEEADKLTILIIKDSSDTIGVENVDFSKDLNKLIYSMLELTRFVDLKKVNPNLESSYYQEKLQDVLVLASNFSWLEKVSIHPEFQKISQQILLQTLDVPRYNKNEIPTSEIDISSAKEVQDRFLIPLSYIQSAEFQDVLQKQLLSLARNKISRYSVERGSGILEKLIKSKIPISGELLINPDFIVYVKERCDNFYTRGVFNIQQIRDVVETYFQFSELDIKDLGKLFIIEEFDYYPATSRGPAHTPQRAVELYSEAIERANAIALLFNISEDEVKEVVRNRVNGIKEILKQEIFYAGTSRESYKAIGDLLERTYLI